MISNKAIVLVLFGAFFGSVLAQSRMYGAYDVSVYEYPFVVSVAYGPDLVGNGAIIATKWIVSSASTFYTTPDEYYSAHVGGDNFGGGQKHVARRIFRHSEFVGWDYNIALMWLSKTISYSDNVKPIQFANEDPDTIDAIMLSYGTNEQGTKHLRAAAFTLASDDNCVNRIESELGKELIRAKHGYCMYPASDSRKGHWHDDAGGPIVINNALYGVFAFSEHPGGYNDVSIVTRTATFKNWIKQKMSQAI